MVQNGPDRKSSNVGRHGRDGEHEIQADLDARINVIGACIGVAGAADILISALLFQDGLEGCISKDYACCEEAVDDRRKHLYCVW